MSAVEPSKMLPITNRGLVLVNGNVALTILVVLSIKHIFNELPKILSLSSVTSSLHICPKPQNVTLTSKLQSKRLMRTMKASVLLSPGGGSMGTHAFSGRAPIRKPWGRDTHSHDDNRNATAKNLEARQRWRRAVDLEAASVTLLNF